MTVISVGRYGFSEMPLGESPAGSGLQVAFEASGVRFIWKLHGRDDGPRPVVHRVAGRAFVVPGESVVDVRGASDVVPMRIALTPQDVDKSGSETSHLVGRGIIGATVIWLTSGRNGAKSFGKYADAAALQARRVRG